MTTATAPDFIGMTNAEYHAHPAIGKSHLDAMARSPKHYWAKYLDPNREPEPQRTEFLIGSAVHAAVLEPDVFNREYVKGIKVDRRTKEGKAAWEEFVASTAGKTILDPDDWAQVRAIAAAVRSHETAGQLLTCGAPEVTCIGTDPETGAAIKARPDWLRTDGLVVDLKTTQDASPDGFGKSAANYRYHVQAAHYIDTMTAAWGEAPTGFVFIAVEKTAPYAIGVYRIEADAIALGRRLARRDLQAIVDCTAAGEWPDYGSRVQTLALPKWAW